MCAFFVTIPQKINTNYLGFIGSKLYMLIAYAQSQFNYLGCMSSGDFLINLGRLCS